MRYKFTVILPQRVDDKGQIQANKVFYTDHLRHLEDWVEAVWAKLSPADKAVAQVKVEETTVATIQQINSAEMAAIADVVGQERHRRLVEAMHAER